MIIKRTNYIINVFTTFVIDVIPSIDSCPTEASTM